MAKPKGEPVTKNQTFLRVQTDKEAAARIRRLAQTEGRTAQRQYGIILERVAQLSREKPEVVKELGLLSPLTSGQLV